MIVLVIVRDLQEAVIGTMPIKESYRERRGRQKRLDEKNALEQAKNEIEKNNAEDLGWIVGNKDHLT